MPKTELKFKWIAPWEWSPRTRQLRIGGIVNAYIYTTTLKDGRSVYYANINESRLGATRRNKEGRTFRKMNEAKNAVEVQVIKMLAQACRQIGR